MNEVKEIVAEIQDSKPKPIYFLTGDEPYYIDKISNYIEEELLDEADKAFNQIVLYGKDSNVGQIIEEAKKFPMMGDRSVVIVKEAQHLSSQIEQLVDYASNPQESTVLVVNYKYKKLDKRKKLAKVLSKNGQLFESKKLYENQVMDWIPRVLASKDYKIEPKAIHMLIESIGTELNPIANELEKLMLICPTGTIISPDTIEENIGISKDFNTFELRKAIGSKDIYKCNLILKYFAENPKNHPVILTVSSLYTFFTQLLKYHGLRDKSKGNVARKLGINIYFADEYSMAARNYPMRKIALIIEELRRIDLEIKGVGNASFSADELLKSLMFFILH